MQPYCFPPQRYVYNSATPLETAITPPRFIDLPTPIAGTLDESETTTSTGKKRAAPGTRGPTPSSCEGCRRLRAKCVRRNGGQVGEEDCLGCLKRGVECRYPKQITRPRTSTAVVRPRAEERLVSTQLSGEAASRLFETYLDHSRVGFEANIIPLLFHDSRSLQKRFYSVGKRLDELRPADQLRSQLVFAASSRRLEIASSSSAEILDQAQEVADRTSIWRKPSYDNLLNLLLLYTLVAKGNIGSPEADHYLSAACTQFPHIFVSSSAELSQPTSSSRGWLAFALAIADTGSALERNAPPYLTNRDFLVFTQSLENYDLPPPDYLLNFLPTSLSRLLDQCTYPITYYIRLARDLATHFSQLDGHFTIEQDINRIQATFRGLDVYLKWWQDCMVLLRLHEINPIARTTAQSAITLNYTLGLMLEFHARDILQRRYESLSRYAFSNPLDTQTTSALASIESLYTISISRCESALCTFLRQTRNRNGIYLLAACTGFIFSVNRLNTIATTLCNASLDRYDLFPVGSLDKLASITFLLKTLEIAKTIHPSSDLEGSIAFLRATQVPLEFECGYSGEMALILVVSTSSDIDSEPTTETHVPDTPSASFVKATEMIAGGG